MSDFIDTGNFLLICFGLFLIVVGLLLLFTSRRRSMFVFYAVVAVIPALVGVIGTLIVFQEVSAVSAGGEALVDMREDMADRAWTTTYLGIAFTIPIFVIALLGLRFKAQRSQQGRTPSNATEGERGNES